jgi:Tol biopolymer transport system component
MYPGTRTRCTVASGFVALAALVALVAAVSGCTHGPSEGAAAVATIQVQPGSVTLPATGSAAQLHAEGRDRNGALVTGSQPVWSSSKPTVASVDGAGMVTAVAAGEAIITARIGTATGTAVVTVGSRGAVRLRIVVTGGGADEDGFALTIGGRSMRVYGDTVLTVPDLQAGDVTAVLDGFAWHCAGIVDRVTLNVLPAQTVEGELRVRCIGDFGYDLTKLETPEELWVVDRFGRPTRIAQDVSGGSWEWSPDGNRIAFSMAIASDFDIYVANADGSGRVRLSTGTDTDTNPSWSPDGRYVAFRSYANEGPVRLNIAHADGSGMRRLIQLPRDAAETVPLWSPAGDLILFVDEPPGGQGMSLWLIAPDGSSLRQLQTSARWNVRPFWSKDGSWIAFSAANDPSVWTLRVIRPDGTGERVLVASDRSGHEPRWSNDGSMLAFQRTGVIARIGFDGSGERLLTPDYGAAFAPAWTVDDQHILFVGRSSLLHESGLMSMNADGTLKQVLLPLEGGAASAKIRPR